MIYLFRGGNRVVLGVLFMKQTVKLWSLFPENPIKLRSIIEMLMFILIFSICAYLFVRWNTVPRKDVVVRVENIGNNDIIQASGLQKGYEVAITFPMTRQDIYIPLGNNVKIKNTLYDPRKITGFAKITSWIDSIRYNYSDNLLSYYDNYDKAERLCESNNVKHEFTKIYGKKDIVTIKIKGDLDSLQNAYVNRKENVRTKRMDYISIDFSLPYGSVFIGSSNGRTRIFPWQPL